MARRWVFFVAIFLAEIAAILLISNLTFFPGELNSTERQYDATKQLVDTTALGQVAGIFANNFRVAGFELIPLGGPTLFAFSIYETARIVEVIPLASGTGETVSEALIVLFSLPSTWLELPAYAIAVTESGFLLYSMFKGWQRFLREIGFLVVSVLLIAGVLVVAAVFEVTEIQLETLTTTSSDPLLGLLLYATWIPFAVVFVLGYWFWKVAVKEAPGLEARQGAEPSEQPSAILTPPPAQA